jgi:hypothetical protein
VRVAGAYRSSGKRYDLTVTLADGAARRISFTTTKQGLHRLGFWTGDGQIPPADWADMAHVLLDVQRYVGPLMANLFEWLAAGTRSIKEVTALDQKAGLVYRKSKAEVPTATVHRNLRNRLSRSCSKNSRRREAAAAGFRGLELDLGEREADGGVPAPL